MQETPEPSHVLSGLVLAIVLGLVLLFVWLVYGL